MRRLPEKRGEQMIIADKGAGETEKSKTERQGQLSLCNVVYS